MFVYRQEENQKKWKIPFSTTLLVENAVVYFMKIIKFCVLLQDKQTQVHIQIYIHTQTHIEAYLCTSQMS